MNYRKTYEQFLNHLCSTYRKMLEILDKIEGFDKLLSDVSNKRRPDADFVYAIATQKERLLAQLDSLSIEIEEFHVNLQLLTYYRINAIMDEEAVETPQVIDKLTACKESMELDLMISEVPKEQKQVFMFIPDKKK